MEYPLTFIYYYSHYVGCCLNPCSNGIPSDKKIYNYESIRMCLNPCSNGIPSDNCTTSVRTSTQIVLILVLMEYPLTCQSQASGVAMPS